MMSDLEGNVGIVLKKLVSVELSWRRCVEIKLLKKYMLFLDLYIGDELRELCRGQSCNIFTPGSSTRQVTGISMR